MERTGNWKRPESVLVLIYSEDEQVLLLQRADDRTFWQSVTGSLEPVETPAEAAEREVYEETGITAAVVDTGVHSTFEIRAPWRARYAPDVTHNLERVFTACVPVTCDVRLSPDEHVACRWMAPPEALALATSPTNRAAIQRQFALDTTSGTLPAADGAIDALDIGELGNEGESS